MAYSAAAALDKGRQAPAAACGHTAGNSLRETGTGAAVAAFLSRFLEELGALGASALVLLDEAATDAVFLADSKAQKQGGTRPNAVSFVKAIAYTECLSDNRGATAHCTCVSVLCISA